ncbi:MAG: hypothetical protein P4K93_07410 [Terracidiphilus sp.]|nr:hypothetical protein [Terracidiphilus sp.]
MATAVQSDFINVQLSAAGVAMAGKNGALQVNTAHLSYSFTPGSPTRVLTSEWAKVLSRELYQGKPIFEPAPAEAAPAPVAVATETNTASAKGSK